MKYKDGAEFENDLLKELQKQARSVQEFQDLKVQLVTERLLARMDVRNFILAGGAAVKYQVCPSPYTRDVDLLIVEHKVKELQLNRMNTDERANWLLDWVKEELAESTGDFFRFRTEHAYAINDLGEGEPCARIILAVELNRHDFIMLELDLALSDKQIPTQIISGRNMLGFAQVENPRIQTMCPEYLIADKSTLYLKECSNENFDRVNDLAHTALLIKRCNLNQEQLVEGLAIYAIKRGVIEKLSSPIPDPPDWWNSQFEESMEQSDTDMTLTQAMDLVRDTLTSARDSVTRLCSERTTDQP